MPSRKAPPATSADPIAAPAVDLDAAIQTTRHRAKRKNDVDWVNRRILGASLARREDLAAKVQMIYIDPPNSVCLKSDLQTRFVHWNMSGRGLGLRAQLSQQARAPSAAMARVAE